MIPIFTIAIPVYNRLNYLRDAISSVLNQNFYDFELLLVDDHSTDGAWEYIQTIKDSRVRAFRNKKNLGAVRNWKRCIEEANGIWFKFLMSDDIMFPYNLLTIYDLIKKYPENYVIVTSGKGFTQLDEIKSYLSNSGIELGDTDNYIKPMSEIIEKRKRFNQTWAMPNSYTLLTEDLKELVKTDDYKEVEDKLGQTGHCVDYFILYSVALKYKTMIEMDVPLYAVRYHESNLSKSYSQNLLYHLNGDKFIHYILYNYKGIENLYIIRHAFRIYINKLFLNKRKIFSLNLFKWTFQLFVFIFQHLFNINKKFSG